MMRLSTRRELFKLRELVHFLLVGQTCYFCKKPLSEKAETFTAHGNATGPKLLDRLTIHHKDGNHDNDAHDNKALCHQKCHRSYHRRVANELRAKSRA